MEYGALAVVAQRQRRSEEDLRSRTPGDGIITGLGFINRSVFGDDDSRCVIMAYDYTVLAEPRVTSVTIRKTVCWN